MSEFDPHRVIDVLARHKVEFVVIGGFAAELYQARGEHRRGKSR